MLENRIKTGKDEVTLMFDTKIYPAKAVLKASEKFTEDFWMFVDGNTEDNIMVRIKSKSGKVDLKEIAFRFFNFVLGTIKEKDF